MKLTHPERFAAWVLVRLRGFPPDTVGGSWARAWRIAARIYRDRAINTMQGLRMAQQDIRNLQQALDEKDDKRPLSGGELDSYIVGLRQRVESLWMHSVDQGREAAELLALAAAQRSALERIASAHGIAEMRRVAQGAVEGDAGAALLAELKAARAVVEKVQQRRRQSGLCVVCGFGTKLGGEEFHGSGCAVAAYQQAVKGAGE